MPVLIVDDNEDICEFLNFIISGLGYRTHTFSQPLSAIAYLKEQKIQPAFLITDYNLPTMTGHELHQQVLAHAPAVKTIVISGSSVQSRIGGLPFLQKPFSPTQIINLLEALKAS